ncbi:MAG: MBL fold metallo-hydrolase [Alphaproteobacteria bacterium]|nr:MBL fold metallo-hydrolase [Alphaproteobacteria bacterium]MBO4643430.1 MBL fold metallo-hydrolase [Alphaproteobacteria bacterium]
MIVKQVEVAEFIETNAYFYIDEKTKHGFLIDPAAQADVLLRVIEENGWTIEKMLITHGHFDHIGAVETLHRQLNIPYVAHLNGQEYLTDGQLNLGDYCNRKFNLTEAEYVNEGDEITLEADSSVKLKVIHTPGHTPDSVLYYDAANKTAFVGDTIFKDSMGATHFPGGNFIQLQQSIKQKVLTLPEDTVLYSGHSEPTTVGAEKKNFL